MGDGCALKGSVASIGILLIVCQVGVKPDAGSSDPVGTVARREKHPRRDQRARTAPFWLSIDVGDHEAYVWVALAVQLPPGDGGCGQGPHSQDQDQHGQD